MTSFERATSLIPVDGRLLFIVAGVMTLGMAVLVKTKLIG
eukprot:gene10765-13671_t